MNSKPTELEAEKQPERKSDDKDRDNRCRILKSSEELFMRYGFKSVTMDEIARHLGVSKKTIYQYFEDKDEIVHECISQHFEDEKCMYGEVLAKAENPVHEFVMEIEHLAITFSSVHPSVLFELRKYHPKAWDVFVQHKEQWIIRSIVENLQKGIEQKLYRPDIEPEILARLRVEQIYIAFDPQVFPTGRFDIRLIHLQFLVHFLHGILTDKGREFFNRYLQTIQTK